MCLCGNNPLTQVTRLQEVVHVISDAYVLSEMDDAAAAAAMAGTHRGIADTNRAVEQLRSTCLSMLCAAMQWDLFRYHPYWSFPTSKCPLLDTFVFGND